MKFYFMGICGTAMGNVAVMMKRLGHEVIGSDVGVYPPMSNVLENAGIAVYEGFDGERLAGLGVDKVVVGNVVSRGNEEVEWLLNQDEVPYCSLPELLREYVLKGRHNVVVAGTHGKTTTTSMVAHLLTKAGVEPGYLIGGVPKGLPSGSTAGKAGSPFVIEGDEYDSSFFDKRSKFIHYMPRVLVLNNLEFDHGDIFRDLEDIKRTFSHLLRVVPGKGYVLTNGDDANLESLMPVAWTQVIRVGVGANNDLRIVGFRDVAGGSEFGLEWKGQSWGQVKWGMSGLYNARNGAMGVLAAALTLNEENLLDYDIKTLEEFEGVKRRQEVLHEDAELVVIEDFAHHPTALRGTLEALKGKHPGRKVVACFEPRSYTACREFHQEGFRDALSLADEVYLGKVHSCRGLAEGMRLDTEKMAEALQSMGTPASAVVENREILEHLTKTVSQGPALVVFFSNGSFDGVMGEYVRGLSFEPASV